MIANEELRRKHIKTLEACQRLVDENVLLKSRNGGISLTEEPASLSLVDESVLEELESLRELTSHQEKGVKDLKACCLAAEERGTCLEAELDSEREHGHSKLTRAQQALNLSEECVSKATDELSEARKNYDHLQNKAADNTALVAFLTTENEVLKAKAAREAEAQQTIQLVLRAAFEKEIETLRSEVTTERAFRLASEETARFKEKELNDAVKATEAAALGNARVKAENVALDMEVRRLSLLQCGNLSASLTIPEVTTPAIPSSLTSQRSVQHSRSLPTAGGAASAKDGNPSKELFAEHVQLKRENQQLRRQIQDLKTTQAKTMSLTRRAIVGNLSGSGR